MATDNGQLGVCRVAGTRLKWSTVEEEAVGGWCTIVVAAESEQNPQSAQIAAANQHR